MDDLQNYFLDNDPLISFLDWYEKAESLEQNAGAMALSTFDLEKKRPNTRYMLYKGIINKKIVFYTNYLSPKSKDLDGNMEVSLAFYWHLSTKQVRIHGRVNKMTSEESKIYFHSRDRESQIASYISHQSAFIADKNSLIEKFNKAKLEFEGRAIPYPENWGGYLVDPYEYEFFLYGENRLNDRFLYQLKNEKWEIQRLQP